MNPITQMALAALLLSTSTAFAAEQTATLEVQNVYCQACPAVIKAALSSVPGVSQVTMSETIPVATATVKFDDTKTNVRTLADTTTNAGFPTKEKP